MNADLYNPYKAFYVAANQTTGLTDVKTWIIRPDGLQLGPFTMTELNPGSPTEGIYFYEFTPPEIEGEYLFICDSVSVPFKVVKAVTFQRSFFQVPVSSGQQNVSLPPYSSP